MRVPYPNWPPHSPVRTDAWQSRRYNPPPYIHDPPWQWLSWPERVRRARVPYDKSLSRVSLRISVARLSFWHPTVVRQMPPLCRLRSAMGKSRARCSGREYLSLHQYIVQSSVGTHLGNLLSWPLRPRHHAWGAHNPD